jgi:hypothetical protein
LWLEFFGETSLAGSGFNFISGRCGAEIDGKNLKKDCTGSAGKGSTAWSCSVFGSFGKRDAIEGSTV